MLVETTSGFEDVGVSLIAFEVDSVAVALVDIIEGARYAIVSISYATRMK